jgi:hypothetical protein
MGRSPNITHQTKKRSNQRRAAANQLLKAHWVWQVWELQQKLPEEAKIRAVVDVEARIVSPPEDPEDLDLEVDEASLQKEPQNSNKLQRLLCWLEQRKLSESERSQVDGAEPKANAFLLQLSELVVLTLQQTETPTIRASVTFLRPWSEV